MKQISERKVYSCIYGRSDLAGRFGPDGYRGGPEGSGWDLEFEYSNSWQLFSINNDQLAINNFCF